MAKVVDMVAEEISSMLDRSSVAGEISKEGIDDLAERVVSIVAEECQIVIDAARDALDYLLHGRTKSDEGLLLTDDLRAKKAMEVLREALVEFGKRAEEL